MINSFKDIPDAIENTVIIAKKCSFFLEERLPKLPKISIQDFDENTFLKKMSFEGLEKRLKRDFIDKNEYEIYKNRLNFELETIIKMGYASYFLIVSDFINWAKNNKIPVGPGRGSGCRIVSSMVFIYYELKPN